MEEGESIKTIVLLCSEVGLTFSSDVHTNVLIVLSIRRYSDFPPPINTLKERKVRISYSKFGKTMSPPLVRQRRRRREAESTMNPDLSPLSLDSFLRSPILSRWVLRLRTR